MYIQYTMDQLCLPMDLEVDIPSNHLVRVVNAAVNQLDDAIFDAACPGGSRNSYHPKMLTKVIIYAYTQRIYSSRQIAKAVRENILFLKNNRGFRRFLLRGMEKVTLEVGWLSLAHNLLQQAANDQKQKAAILQ